MDALYFVLFLAAAILFLISAIDTQMRRVDLQALGLLCFVIPFALHALEKV